MYRNNCKSASATLSCGTCRTTTGLSPWADFASAVNRRPGLIPNMYSDRTDTGRSAVYILSASNRYACSCMSGVRDASMKSRKESNHVYNWCIIIYDVTVMTRVSKVVHMVALLCCGDFAASVRSSVRHDRLTRPVFVSLNRRIPDCLSTYVTPRVFAICSGCDIPGGLYYDGAKGPIAVFWAGTES